MTPLQEKGKKCEDIARNHYLKQGKKVEKINNGGDFKVTDPDGKILIVEVKTKKSSLTPKQRQTRELSENLNIDYEIFVCTDEMLQNQPQNEQSDPCGCK